MCEWCGGGFLCIPAKVAYGEGKFCSRSCLGSASIKSQQGRRSSIEFKVEDKLVEWGVEFIAQHKVGPWLVDFYIPHLNMVLECDGDYWHSLPRAKARDRQKNGWMLHNDYALFRMTETQINAEEFEKLEQLVAA